MIILYFETIVYLGILLMGSILGVLHFKELNQSMKILCILLIITFFSESLSEMLYINLKNNLPIFHIYNPIQFTLLAIAYNYELKNRMVIYFFIIIYIISSIINSIFFQSFFDEFCSNSININFILVCYICLWYLYRLLHEDTNNKFSNYPLFWISIGYLFANSTNLVGLGLFNTITDKEISNIFQNVRNFVNWFLYIVYIFAFYSKQASLQ